MFLLPEFDYKNDLFSFEYHFGTTKIFYQISLSESYPGTHCTLTSVQKLPITLPMLCYQRITG